ncbi:MAG TPA: UPF0280 family protein [Verrucomicrobiae bacterium]|nr:UPF0280 family protein [Verrucomicrobiae bacterium]
MREPAQIRILPGGKRLHLHDGPMDLIVEAYGGTECVRAAYRAAAERFVGILDELCGELELLRQEAGAGSAVPEGIVAKRMFAAVAPFAASAFITPMAAVAGAVAEEILRVMTSAAALSRAYANNGGDIALHLAPGEEFSVALVDRPDEPSLFGRATLRAEDGIRGIATSGWRGRSFSLGIADAVTILAATAAGADAAATIVANAVDLPGHPAIERVAAREIQPDTDLGEMRVTRAVGPLQQLEIEEALARGLAKADELLAAGWIGAAALHLQGETISTGIYASPEKGRFVSPGSPSGGNFLHA